MCNSVSVPWYHVLVFFIVVLPVDINFFLLPMFHHCYINNTWHICVIVSLFPGTMCWSFLLWYFLLILTFFYCQCTTTAI